MKICEICKKEIEPAHAAAQKVVAWVIVKNGRTTSTLIRSVSEVLGWSHQVCLQSREAEEQPSLF